MGRQFADFAALIREKPAFRRLWIAHIISLLGDWFSYIAVSLISIDRGGGALAVGMVLVAHTLPTALMSPISGPLADRYDRRKLLLAGYTAAACLTFVMWGAANSHVWLVQGILFLRVCVSGIGMTARSASVPQLVGQDQLHNANALLGLTWSIAFTVGLALGGFVSSILSPRGAILIDAFTFIGAVLVYRGLPALPPTAKGDARPRPGLRDMIVAWRFVKASPGLLTVLFAKTPAMMVNAGGWLALNLTASQRMAPMEAAVALGITHSIRAIGTGVGPLIPAHWIPRQPLVGPALVFLGVGLFTVFENPLLYMLGLFIWGAGGGHNWVAATAELQRRAPSHIIGRITALDFFLFSLAESVVALVGGWLIDRTGHPMVGAWAALGVALVFWLYLLRLNRASRLQSTSAQHAHDTDESNP